MPNPAEQAQSLSLKQLLIAIRKPIIIATAINMLCTFSLMATLHFNVVWFLGFVNFLAPIVCLVWAGRIAYTEVKPSIIHASLAGPALAFFSYFFVRLISNIRFLSSDWEPPARFADTLWGNPFLVMLIAPIVSYLVLFPIAMGLAALGAAYEKKKTHGPGIQAIKADEMPLDEQR